MHACTNSLSYHKHVHNIKQSGVGNIKLNIATTCNYNSYGTSGHFLVIYILNKNNKLAVKRCEANQKQL